MNSATPAKDRYLVGDSVRYTRNWLKSTGMLQSLGHHAYMVIDCDCDMCIEGEFVAVKSDVGRKLHINIHNICPLKWGDRE